MDWIAVHSDVLGGKLRGLRKRIGCSEAEALGALTILWLWARNNASESGELRNTEESDIANAIEHSLSRNMDPVKVVEAMIIEGWIDKIEGVLFIHDWSEWQSYWYAYKKRKASDAERQRRHRLKEKEIEEEKPKEEPKPKAPKKPKEEKVKFAEFVQMKQEEFDKLVEQYGEPFAMQCITELDNYKGSSGKKYKSDYRAILNWVVDRVKEKYPKLKAIVPQPIESDSGANSFEEYRDLW